MFSFTGSYWYTIYRIELVFLFETCTFTNLRLFVGLSTSDKDTPYVIYSSFIKTMTAVFVCGELWYAYSEPLSLDEIAACVNVIVIHLITLYKLKNLVSLF